MANLLIRKSASENISIPLTTKKPIARSLAVFKDGQIHYAPLVHSGDSLDSGVKVRIGRIDYALATQIYDPTVYDSRGDDWIVEGASSFPDVHYRGTIFFPGDGGLVSNFTTHLDAYSSFRFSATVYSYKMRSDRSSGLFSIYNESKPGSTRCYFAIDASQKLRIATGTASSNVKYFSCVITPYEMYKIRVDYNGDNTFTAILDGTILGTVTLKLPENDYTIMIGNVVGGTNNGFVGEMTDLEFYARSRTHRFRAGD